MTDAERAHLVRILGMLGSAHAGERAAAGLQAEAFRKKHGLSWAEMIDGRTVYVGGNPPWYTPPPQPPPQPTWTPPPVDEPEVRITNHKALRVLSAICIAVGSVFMVVMYGPH